MIKKKKKLLFAFIVLIILVLLFSVIGVITIYLSGPTQHQGYPSIYPEEAIQQVVNDVTLTGSTISITTGSGEVLTGELQQ